MDGLLLNTEAVYTKVTNEILKEFGVDREFTWDVKLRVQGLTGDKSAEVLIEEYNLPTTPDEIRRRNIQKQASEWPRSQFLPGALELLEELHGRGVPMALGTSSNNTNFASKTQHLQHGFALFDGHVVTGDDPRLPPGRGKPHPDIWAACLASLNDKHGTNIEPHECLVFEDGIPGVEAGKALGAHVIWIPDPNALKVLQGRERHIIGNRGSIYGSITEFVPEHFGL